MAGGSESGSPSMVFRGRVNVSATPLPACRAARSVTAVGTAGLRACGSPGAAQPAASANTSRETPKPDFSRRESAGRGAKRKSAFRVSIFEFRMTSEDVAAQVLVLDNVGELFADVGGINLHRLFLQLRRLKGNFVQYFFEDGVQPPRADIFGVLVHRGGKPRQRGDGVLRDAELDALGLQQSGVLLDEGVLGLGENADEIRFAEGLQLDADG